MKAFRVGVIGCGAIAQNCHLPGYSRCKDVSLEAAADVEPARLAEVQRKFGVKRVYRDYRRMLDKESLDVVSVCTPNYLHADAAIRAADAGCHIFCEKPMALSMKEAAAIETAARRNRVRVMLGFSHRFYAGNQKARQLIDDGAIGKPFMIRVRFAHGGPQPGWAMSDWFYSPRKAGGGACLDMGIHAYDLCEYLLGPVTAVQADIRTLVKKIKVDDNAIVVFDFKRGAMGYVEVGWTSKPGFVGLEVYGTEGTIIGDYFGEGLIHIAGTVSPSGKAGTSRKVLVKDYRKGGWDVEVQEFIDALKTGKPFRAGIAEGKRSLRIALAGYKAARTGKRFRIAP